MCRCPAMSRLGWGRVFVCAFLDLDKQLQIWHGGFIRSRCACGYLVADSRPPVQHVCVRGRQAHAASGITEVSCCAWQCGEKNGTQDVANSQPTVMMRRKLLRLGQCHVIERCDGKGDVYTFSEGSNFFANRFRKLLGRQREGCVFLQWEQPKQLSRTSRACLLEVQNSDDPRWLGMNQAMSFSAFFLLFSCVVARAADSRQGRDKLPRRKPNRFVAANASLQ